MGSFSAVNKISLVTIKREEFLITAVKKIPKDLTILSCSRAAYFDP